MAFTEEELVISKKYTRLNNDIRAKEVRLVDATGEQLGIVSIVEALSQAKQAGSDLVEISPNAAPPVCKIMDFGKYLFSKKKKRQTSSSKTLAVKEVKFRPVTDIGDYRVKLNKITKFLEEGHKVKVTLRFRGREMAHQEIGAKMLQRIEDDLLEFGEVEQRPKLEGRQVSMVIAPKRNK